jgi:hypothetical protein
VKETGILVEVSEFENSMSKGHFKAYFLNELE